MGQVVFHLHDGHAVGHADVFQAATYLTHDFAVVLASFENGVDGMLGLPQVMLDIGPTVALVGFVRPWNTNSINLAGFDAGEIQGPFG